MSDDFNMGLMSDLCAHYQDLFWSVEGSAARAYMKSRGFTDTILREFRIGYATKTLSLALTQEEEEVLKGQSHIYEGRADRFGNRVVFPVSDAQGNVCGFSGRVIPPSTAPKYMNSADSGIYHKSLLLFGLDLAREAIFKSNKAIICEGFTDVMAFRQVGVPIAVASMGTSLTTSHLKQLSRYTDSLYFSFDGDSGGDTAQSVAPARAKEVGFKLGRIPIPSGADPASYLLSTT